MPPAANAATTPAAPVNSRRRRSITHVPVASPSLALVADRGSTGTTAPRSRRSAITPATVAALAGSASDDGEIGRVSADTTPIVPKARSPATPTQRRLRQAIPRATAASSNVAPIPPSRTVLSFSPNVLMARPFSHSGVASIALWPTVRMGEAAGFTMPATSSAVPIATPAATRPITAPTPSVRQRSRLREGGAGRTIPGAPARPRWARRIGDPSGSPLQDATVTDTYEDFAAIGRTRRRRGGIAERPGPPSGGATRSSERCPSCLPTRRGPTRFRGSAQPASPSPATPRPSWCTTAQTHRHPRSVRPRPLGRGGRSLEAGTFRTTWRPSNARRGRTIRARR